MAGAILTAPLDPLTTAADWTNLLAINERPNMGREAVSLTEWASGNTNKPEIAAGSVIEIDGSIAYYATQTALTDIGGLTDGWCYIKHVVSGTVVTPTLTNTWGTWDTAKQGYYDGSGNRYSLFAMYRSGAVTKIYSYKSIFEPHNFRHKPIDTDERFGVYVDWDSPNNGGEKLKRQIVRMVGNSAVTMNFTHTISNAATNDRVLDVRWSVRNTASPNPSGGDGYTNYITNWTTFDTYIRVITSAATSPLSTYVILITYI